MIDLVRLCQAIREGGDTKRVHTIPVLTDPSIARHSWNMAMLAWHLCDFNPSVDFIMYLLAHDVAERWTGDTPGPAKDSMHPPLGVEIRKLEKAINEKLELRFDLTENERNWARAIDWLEFFIYCEGELAMGNRNVEPAHVNTRRHILESEWVPEPVKMFCAAYTWERTHNFVKGELFGKIENLD